MINFWKSFWKPTRPDSDILVLKKVPDDPTIPTYLPDSYRWADNVKADSWISFLHENYGNADNKIVYPVPILEYWISDPDVQTKGILDQHDNLVGVLSGKVCEVMLVGKLVKGFNIDFLCVHRNHRRQGLAGCLIHEITRYAKLNGIWVGLHTSKKECLDVLHWREGWWSMCVGNAKKSNVILEPTTLDQHDLTKWTKNDWCVEQVRIRAEHPFDIFSIKTSGKVLGIAVCFPIEVWILGIPHKTYYIYALWSDPDDIGQCLDAIKGRALRLKYGYVYTYTPPNAKLSKGWKKQPGKLWQHIYNFNKDFDKTSLTGRTLFWTY